MNIQSKRLAIRQLDRTLSPFRELRDVPLPRKGWIHSIRKALGMSAAQLGERAGMSQPAIVQIEKSEADGAATITTLKKMAAALDCTYVHALVPNSSLEEFLATQAEDVARRRVLGTAHSMALESQSVPDARTQEQIDMLRDEILATLPRYIWAQDGS